MNNQNPASKSPLVSVIMPCFNHGIYLDEAVNSVLLQTYKNVEIIIINDGSTDAFTKELLKHYAKPKTTVMETNHVGPSLARNSAIKKAHGKYILPLDSDDRIAKTYIEKAVKILEKDSKMGIVYCKAEMFDGVNKEWDLPNYSFEQLLINNMIFVSAVFRKRDWERVGGFNKNMKHGLEDYDFWLSLIELGVKVYRIPEILFYYRIHFKDSRTASLSKRKDEDDLFVTIFNNHKKLYLDNIKVIISNRRKLEVEVNELRPLVQALMSNPTYKFLIELEAHPFRKKVFLKLFKIFTFVYFIFFKH